MGTMVWELLLEAGIESLPGLRVIATVFWAGLNEWLA